MVATTRQKADRQASQLITGTERKRWIKSFLLAASLNAAGIGVVGIIVVPAPTPAAGGTRAILHMQLRPVPVVVRDGFSESALSSTSFANPQASFVQQASPATTSSQHPDQVLVLQAEPDLDVGQSLQAHDDPLSAGATTGSEVHPVETPATESGIAKVPSEKTDGLAPDIELMRHIEFLIHGNLKYPPLARKRNIEGAVQFSLLIGKDGTLTDRSLTKSSGSTMLDKAAMELVDSIFPLALTHAIDDPVTVRIQIMYSLTS